jgi:hypothetical protein
MKHLSVNRTRTSMAIFFHVSPAEFYSVAACTSWALLHQTHDTPLSYVSLLAVGPLRFVHSMVGNAV